MRVDVSRALALHENAASEQRRLDIYICVCVFEFRRYKS